MAQTSARVGDSIIVKNHPELHFDIGKIHYEIRKDANRDTLSVSDGQQSLTTSLLWAFGNGRVGQSYLFKKKDGSFYEARVSYFATLKNLHFTPSRALENPKNLDEAIARPVTFEEVQRCFSCHSTAAIIGTKLDEQNLIPGVSCEACHGPGAEHVAAAQAAEMAGAPEEARGAIFNAGKLKPADAVDYCGACHFSYWDMKLSHTSGVSTSKAQPFRLEESKCWGSKGDARLTCTACHDPHQPLVVGAAAYDHNCLECHVTTGMNPTGERPGRACPVSSNQCTSCHMPKQPAPTMHYAFTDHRIRIVKPGETYPE